MFSDDFIFFLQVEKRASQHTIVAYLQDLTEFIEFAGVLTNSDWKEINHHTVRGFNIHLFEKGNSNKSIARKLSTLRSFYKWGVRENAFEINPMLRIKSPRIEKRLPTFIQESELDDIKIQPLFGSDFDGIRDRLMFELFYQTGIRLSELILLKERAIELNHIKVLGKRNKERIIPISKELHEQIQNFLSLKSFPEADREVLMIQKNGKKLSPMFVYRKINSYLSSLSNVQKKSPHVMRHTFATHMLNRGAGLETLKELLGHADLSATQVYTHNSFAQINSIYSQAHPRGGRKK
jgi:integrase/recombinase XerC